MNFNIHNVCLCESGTIVFFFFSSNNIFWFISLRDLRLGRAGLQCSDVFLIVSIVDPGLQDLQRYGRLCLSQFTILSGTCYCLTRTHDEPNVARESARVSGSSSNSYIGKPVNTDFFRSQKICGISFNFLYVYCDCFCVYL